MIHKLKGIDMVEDLNSGLISVGKFTEFPLEMSYSGPFRIRTRTKQFEAEMKKKENNIPSQRLGILTVHNRLDDYWTSLSFAGQTKICTDA